MFKARETCDFCGAEGERELGAYAPEGWFYTDVPYAADRNDSFVQFACKPECCVAVWHKGPGQLSDKTKPLREQLVEKFTEESARRKKEMAGKFKIGDTVRYKAHNGSCGRVVHIRTDGPFANLPRIYVELVFGQDVNGDLSRSTAGFDVNELAHVPEAEVLAIENRRLGT